MDYKEVIQQVRIVLPQLNLNPEQYTIPILNEIVERSGLLLSIDNDERFQFAHLTLQEFFAASELVDNPGGLFERFFRDQVAWRETAKLWCGLAGDSTNLIQKIYKKDTITAFECLADAQKVEQSICEEIIDSFKSHLKSPGEGELVLRAFGSVASDLRPRGKAVFNFLEEALIKENDASIKLSAAKALSFTNLPKAAKLLAGYSVKQPVVRSSLVRMGDLVVTELTTLAQSGHINALYDLQVIGTPQAVEALIPFLWNKDSKPANHSAWCLASMLHIPNIENVMRNYTLSQSQIKEELQITLIQRLVKGPEPTKKDWINNFRPVKYDFQKGWHYKTIFIFLIILSLTALFKIVLVLMNSTHWSNWVSLALIFLGWFIYWSFSFDYTTVEVMIGSSFFPIYVIFQLNFF